MYRQVEMERDYRGGSVGSEANMEHSWGESDNETSPMRRSESSSIVRSGFRFRLSGSGDAMSLQSGDTSPMMSGRFTTAALRRSRGGDQNGGDAEEEEEEYGDEEEEDDDHMRHSWTTEKEPVAMRYRFARTEERTQETKEDGEDENDQEEEKEEEEEEVVEEDGEDSFGSMEWWVREQRHLERQALSAGDNEEDDDNEEEDEENEAHDGVEDSVEKSVRAALSLLNGNAEDEEEEEEEEHEKTEDAWGASGAETAERRLSSYFDIVQEARVTEWARGRAYSGGEEEEEEEGDQEEEVEETTTAAAQEEQEPDEWLEAFTAKGRVYYYNRRTRESSWTKPISVLEREAAVEESNEAEETDGEPQEEEEHFIEGQFDLHGEEEAEEEDKDEVHERHSFQASLRSSTSSTASSENQNAQEESFQSLHSSSASARAADTLFCCFCGSPVRGANGFQFHFSRCETLHHHKLTMSPLYEQFQQMFVLLSEDSTLRVMHYASSFPDATPQQPDGSEPTQQSVRESLVLLRVKHRSNVKPLVHKTPDSDRVPAFQALASDSSRGRSAAASSKRSSAATAAAPRESPASRYNSMKQKPTPVAMLNMETCRHCSRSFAEGRLAKHEAVCPRVFGNETSWGRGAASSTQKQSSGTSASAADAQTQHQQSQRRQDMLRTLQKKRTASLKHTLALSFQEHQASLVECPCCRRKFAPSGAQQHIDICKTVQHRPRNHVPLMKDYAIAS